MFLSTALRVDGGGILCPSRYGRSTPRLRPGSAASLRLSLWSVPLLASCTLAPSGTQEERDRSDTIGAQYESPIEQRALAELPPSPVWRDILQRAFMANGELEASYYDWKAAVERIGIASAYPNSNLTLGYSVALGQGNMNAFDRMTFSAGFDSMQNLSLPVKVKQAGKIALDEARAAGERFRAMKFDLQRRVLSAWAEYSLLAEKRRIENEDLVLARVVIESSRAHVAAGTVQQDLLKSEIAVRRAEDRIATIDAELSAQRATLNALLGRVANAPLSPPDRLPEPRPLAADDATLIVEAVDENAELAALAREVEGRRDALELAKLQWLPDINPSLALTGGVTQAIGAAVVLPTTIAAIDGRIREAESMLRSAEAVTRQTRSNRASSYVATLVALRNSERQAKLFRIQIVPAAERILDAVRQSYVAGRSTLLDLLDAQRTSLDARMTAAEAATSREIRLAELEALAGIDFETLSKSKSARASDQGMNAAGASAEGRTKE